MHSSSAGVGPRFLCRPLPPEIFVLPAVRLFDPSLDLDTVGDLVVGDGRIGALGPEAARPEGAEVLEAYRGCTVFPGFVDMHGHGGGGGAFRQATPTRPGQRSTCTAGTARRRASPRWSPQARPTCSGSPA